MPNIPPGFEGVYMVDPFQRCWRTEGDYWATGVLQPQTTSEEPLEQDGE